MQKKVSFKHGGWTMSGMLFLPDDFDETKKYAALVFGNPGGSVKEQTPYTYARRLAQGGFVALAFDSSHQGESEGEPRLLDNPYNRTEDVKCAVDFLTTLPYVDRQRIGAVGQCAGSGFVIFASLIDRRIKAVCGLCCTNPGATTRQGWDGTRTIAEDIKILDEIAEQRTAEANGAPVRYAHYVPEDDELPTNPYPEMVEGNRFYRHTAKHPNSVNRFIFTGMADRMTFDAYEFIPDLLDRPFLVIAGSEAQSLWQSKRAYELAKGPKELCIMEGAGHFDFYGNATYIEKTTTKLLEFFGKNLA